MGTLTRDYPLTSDLAPFMRNGLLFWAPLMLHPEAVYPWGNVNPSTLTIDADRWHINPANELLVAGTTDFLPMERLGAVFEGTETNNVSLADYRDFSTAGWTASSISVDSDSIVTPDGTTRTTNTLTASGANGTLITDMGVIASAAKVFSVWLKRKTGTGDIDLTLDNGSNWETVTVTDAWQRFFTTRTVANPDVGIQIVTSGDAVYADFAQHEHGRSDPTSNIVGGATGSAPDVRFAINTQDIIKAAEGTIILAYTPQHTGNSAGAIGFLFDGRTAGNEDGVTMFTDSSSGVYRVQVRSGSSTQANVIGTTTPVRGTTNIISAVWGLNDVQLYVDGIGEGTPDTSATAPTAVHASSLYIGQDRTNGSQGHGNIAHFMIWDRILTAQEEFQANFEIRRWMGLL